MIAAVACETPSAESEGSLGWPGAEGAQRGTFSTPLLAVLLLGLVVRLAVFAWFWGEPLQIEDEQHYNAIAVNLATTGEFALEPGQPTSLRPPLYPMLVAGIYRVFGCENYEAVRLVQMLLGLSIAVLVHAMARPLFGARVALLSAALCCFYPSLIIYGNLLLTEILFTWLLCAVCLALEWFLLGQGLRSLVAFGVLWGLATLTRSVLWLFPPFVFVFLFLAVRAAGWRQRLFSALLPVAVFGLTILPWSVRNSLLQDTFTTIDVMGGRNFMMGNYEHTPLYRAWDAIGMQGEKAWHHVLLADFPGRETLTQGQIDKLAMRRAVRFMLENPALTLKRSVVKFFNFWQLERELVAGARQGFWGELSRGGVLVFAAAVCGSYVVVIVSGVFGFVLVPASDRRMHWFLLMLVGFMCALHTASFGHSRYHLPVMPLVTMYSAAAMLALPSLLGKWRRPAFWLAGAICVLLAGSWVWEAVIVDASRIRALG